MAHTLSVPPRSNLPSMSHLPFQEMDNALAPAHLCALFGGVLGLNFRIWWTNMAIEIPHFSLGDTSSQGPCSAALLVYERVSFLRVLLPSKNDGWGEIHADYSHFWRKKHPERWYLLAYRYLNVWFFVEKYDNTWHTKLETLRFWNFYLMALWIDFLENKWMGFPNLLV